MLGTIGYETQNFADLFTSKSFVGTIGPSVRWDILNYGRLLNGIRVEDAKFQTAALDYQNSVLRAGREVEDGVVVFLRSQTRTRQLIESAKEAKIAADEAVVLSKDVKFDLNRAFVTSNFLVQQQDKLAVAIGDIAQGLIQVYKALGGGWEIRLDGMHTAVPVRLPPREIVPVPPAPVVPAPPPAMGRARLGAPSPTP